MPYIYCTATCDGAYCEYEPVAAAEKGAPRRIKKKLIIKGGANIPNQFRQIFAAGETKVSDTDLEWLKKNDGFQRHEKAGFIKVTQSKQDPAKVARDMTPKDGCAPKTPNDAEYKNKSVSVGTDLQFTDRVKNAVA